MNEDIPDPYTVFFDWCVANGFKDVADCKPEDLDPKRMDLAITAYGKAGRVKL